MKWLKQVQLHRQLNKKSELSVNKLYHKHVPQNRFFSLLFDDLIYKPKVIYQLTGFTRSL
jgi:hypothetical protein